MRAHDLDTALAELAARATSPYAVNVPLYRSGVDEVLERIAGDPVPIVIGSQGGPARYVAAMQAAGKLCVHVVAGVEHAQKARDAGVDAVIVVGGEAGGHPPASLVSTLVLVRAVAKAMPGLPIIASGGFADGAGLAAGLALGAGAVQFGTRFIASAESHVHDAYRDAVLRAGVGDTRTVGRDLGVIRVLRNGFSDRMDELEAAAAPLDARTEAFRSASLKQAAFEGDVAGGKLEAGQSAGLIDEVLPAATIVERITAEYLAVIDALPRP
jgi:enoyl-[acyl-carrier protein] reductase II